MARSECAACGRVFGGLTGFDRHQELVGDRYNPDLVCRDPTDLGMVQRDDGVWITEAPKFAEGGRQFATKPPTPVS